MLSRSDCRCSLCNYGIWVKVHNFFRQAWQTVVATFGRSGIDNKVLAFDVPQFSHPLTKTVKGI
jgi:hypothetical protein